MRPTHRPAARGSPAGLPSPGARPAVQARKHALHSAATMARHLTTAPMPNRAPAPGQPGTPPA